MLKKERRISKEIFKSIGKPSLFVNVQGLTGKVWNVKLSDPSRFSFSISKKIQKSAVSRNKARRDGYKIMRNILSEAKDGFLVQFIFNSKPDSNLEKNIKEILTKAHIIN